MSRNYNIRLPPKIPRPAGIVKGNPVVYALGMGTIKPENWAREVPLSENKVLPFVTYLFTHAANHHSFTFVRILHNAFITLYPRPISSMRSTTPTSRPPTPIWVCTSTKERSNSAPLHARGSICCLTLCSTRILSYVCYEAMINWTKECLS